MVRPLKWPLGVKSLIRDDCRNDCSVEFVEYLDNPGERLSPLECLQLFITISFTTTHTLNHRFSTVAILFILLQLKTLARDIFPIQIAFVTTISQAEVQTPQPVATYIYIYIYIYILNQQSEYKVFYKLMCWLSESLTCRLPNVMRSPPARRSPKFNHS